jgi:uncharacterized protein YndB with AHSA1/START domain
MPANPLKLLKLKPTGFQFIQQVKIDATPARVWKILIDMPGWFRFDPAIKKKIGKCEPWVGGRFYGTYPDGSSMLHAIITRIDPERLLRMSGPMGLSHLPVTNAFIFELSPQGKGGTLLRLCQRTFGFLDADVKKRYAEGWKYLLPQMKALAEGKRPPALGASNGSAGRTTPRRMARAT